MRFPRDIIESRTNNFVSECRQRGLTVTHQRLEIFRELASTDEHPDAETLHRRVRKRLPTISPDTVYRNLKLLAQEGLILIVGLGHERLRFDANTAIHPHFVCVQCGRILDFTAEATPIAMPAEAGVLGRPISLHLEVRGVCNTCETCPKVL